jgi:hypothetical protein
LNVIVGVGACAPTTCTVLALLVAESPEYAGRKLVEPTGPYPWEVTATHSCSAGTLAAMGTLAVK